MQWSVLPACISSQRYKLLPFKIDSNKIDR